MGEYGTCETGCIERKLELVRAAASDALAELSSTAGENTAALRAVAEELLADAPAEEEQFRSLQARARATLAEHPDTGRDEDWAEPSEPAVTWWCEKCGGIDAPQPCLGICLWRPVEWVNRSVYEQDRERAIAERARERRVRALLQQIVAVRPRPDHMAENWSAFAAQAREALVLGRSWR